MQSDGTARVGDASIRWRRAGAGPVIVFLHGFPLSGATWGGVVERLRERYTCIASDLIGLGESRSRSSDDYSSQGQARVVRGLLNQLEVSSYALVGNDTGGWIARELGLIDRDRISHLVLTNTEIPFHRPPWIPTYQALAGLPGAGAVLRTALGSAAFRRSSLGFGGCFFDLARLAGSFHDRHVRPLLESDDLMQGALEFLRRMKFARIDEFQLLHRQLTMPTLFLWGADDPTFPEPAARAMLPQFPNVAGFQPVERAKLFFYEEHPAEVARRIDDFLSGERPA